MQQEMIQERELEFVPREKPKYECVDCKDKFRHIEHYKDGKDRCKNCKKKLITNIFYNPFWKKKEYVGIRNLSHQEKNMLIRKYQNKGYNYTEAKRKVEYDLKVVQGTPIRKVIPESQFKNLDIKKTDRSQNEQLIKGLGLKK